MINGPNPLTMQRRFDPLEEKATNGDAKERPQFPKVKMVS
jgi:hypothetical protein